MNTGPSDTAGLPLPRWMRERALPFWASAGVDASTGAFHEKLGLDGAPDMDAPRRVRVQARQIYVYAHAACLGWSEGLPVAMRAFAMLLRTAHAPDGAPGFVHLLRPDGGVADARRDTYDHAFLLLAFCWLDKASGDPTVRRALEDMLGFVDAALTLPDGTLREGAPDALPRRQNPHMHTLESWLALRDVQDWPGAPARVSALASLLAHRFLAEDGVSVREFFTADWRPAPGAAGAVMEPGHNAEWAWLLRQAERRDGAVPSPLPTALLGRARHFTDPAGFLPDEGDLTGRTVRASRRLWPQTELAKAWIAEAEIGRPGARAEADAACARIMTYLDMPFAGGWIDQFDAGGRPLSVDVPASTLYHLFVAAVEAARVLR